MIHKYLIIACLCFLSVGAVLSEEDKRLRMVVPRDMELVYKVDSKVKGESLDPLSDLLGSELRVDATHFGEAVDFEKYVIYSKSEKATSLRTLFPLGGEFVFLHPMDLGFTRSGQKKDLVLNILNGCPMTCEIKASYTSSSWTYICNLLESDKNLLPLREGQYLNKPERVVKKLNLVVRSKFDKSNFRVKSASLVCKYESGFKNFNNQDINKNSETSARFTFDYEVKSATSYKSRLKRAIDLSRKQLWNVLLKHYDLEEILKRLQKKDKQTVVGRGFLGEMGLALFAVLRAGMSPEEKEMEKKLLSFIDFFDHVYYDTSVPYEGWVVYDYAVALMVFEAALNHPLHHKKNKKAKRYRGSKKLQKAMLAMAEKCTTLLSTGRGHVWTYSGRREKLNPGGYSRAQYAVLGLRSAKLLDLDVPSNVWEDICAGVVKDYFVSELANDMKEMERRAKKKEGKENLAMTFFSKGYFEDQGNELKLGQRGGWRYQYEAGKSKNKAIPKFTMTCSALGNLVMASKYSGIKNKEMIEVITGGLDFLASRLNDYIKRPHYNYYIYYSFERPAVFFNLKEVNGVNWHQVMSEKIMGNQMTTGAFSRRKYGIVCSAYALLFLTKATRALYTVDVEEE